jgi:hypothetical protein
MPNFEAHPDDLPTLERNEVRPLSHRSKLESCES